MNEPQWERLTTSGRERWNLVEWMPYASGARGMHRHVIGFIIKRKNKHRCRDWYVMFTEHGGWDERTHVGTLCDMKTPEAQAAARLLILAQRSDT